MEIKKQKDFIICPICNGKGMQEKRTSNYDSEIVKCDYCNGRRVVQEVVTTEHFKVDSNA